MLGTLKTKSIRRTEHLSNGVRERQNYGVSDENSLLSYNITTSAGQEGSGIVYKDERSRFYVVGEHVSVGPELNTGCLFTKAGYEEMRKWINYPRRKRQERI